MALFYPHSQFQLVPHCTHPSPWTNRGWSRSRHAVGTLHGARLAMSEGLPTGGPWFQPVEMGKVWEHAGKTTINFMVHITSTHLNKVHVFT